MRQKHRSQLVRPNPLLTVTREKTSVFIIYTALVTIFLVIFGLSRKHIIPQIKKITIGFVIKKDNILMIITNSEKIVKK